MSVETSPHHSHIRNATLCGEYLTKEQKNINSFCHQEIGLQIDDCKVFRSNYDFTNIGVKYLHQKITSMATSFQHHVYEVVTLWFFMVNVNKFPTPLWSTQMSQNILQTSIFALFNNFKCIYSPAHSSLFYGVDLSTQYQVEVDPPTYNRSNALITSKSCKFYLLQVRINDKPHKLLYDEIIHLKCNNDLLPSQSQNVVSQKSFTVFQWLYTKNCP